MSLQVRMSLDLQEVSTETLETTPCQDSAFLGYLNLWMGGRIHIVYCGIAAERSVKP